MPASVSGLVPPLKWHGGKHYLAGRIVALMPPHLHFVEPYFGGGSVLLAKDPNGVSEVANDIDQHLTNFWRTLQDGKAFAAFHRRVTAIPFSQREWEDARDLVAGGGEGLEAAVSFFVHCRQSLAGRRQEFAPLSKTRTRRRMNEQASAWITAVDGLPAVHERLLRVVVLCRPAIDVIRSEDNEHSLFYLDPPYLDETRSVPDVYGYEMSRSDHRELLDLVQHVRGKVMLSGYPSGLYDAALAGWNRHTFDLANHAAGGRSKARETEVLWCNF